MGKEEEIEKDAQSLKVCKTRKGRDTCVSLASKTWLPRKLRISWLSGLNIYVKANCEFKKLQIIMCCHIGIDA